MYGSITEAGTARVLRALAGLGGGDAAGALGPGSVVLDVGAGLGRPLLHAAVAAGCSGGIGVEVDSVKCEKAAAFLRLTLARLAACGDPEGALERLRGAGGGGRLPAVFCADVGGLRTVEPATHVYSFWEGIPGDARAALGALVRKSRSVRGVAVVQRALRGGRDGAEGAMAELGFGALRLEASFPVAMSGSGRGFVAYIFARAPPPPAAAADDFPPELALDRLAAAAAARSAAAAPPGARRGKRRPAGAPAPALGRAKRPRGPPAAAAKPGAAP